MNKRTEQSELSQVISQQTLLDEYIVGAFVGELFTEIENSIIVDSNIKVDGLGLFKIIKSGDTHRILFLGNNTSTNKPIEKSRIKTQNIESVYDTESVAPGEGSIVQNKIPADIPKVNIPKADSSNADIPKVDTSKVDTSKADNTLVDNTKKEEEAIEIENAVAKNEDEADAIVIRKFIESEKNFDTHLRNIPANAHHRKYDFSSVKTYIVILIILALLGIAYIALLGSSVKPKEKITKAVIFRELENTDKLNCIRMVIPDLDVSLQEIAKTYYGKDTYWTYIFDANKNIVSNQFIIQAGSITKIPKIAINLVEPNTGNEASTTQTSGDLISKETKQLDAFTSFTYNLNFTSKDGKIGQIEKE